MYSLIKILSDEPEKIEAFVLSILKLTITLWVVGQFWGVDSISLDILNGDLNGVLPSSQILLFIASLIVTWFILWSFVRIAIIKFIAYLMSFIGSGQYVFIGFVNLNNFAETEKTSLVSPDKNTPDSIEFIQEVCKGNYFSKSTRSDIYLTIGSILLFIFFSANLTPNWINITGLVILGFMYYGMITGFQLERYVEKNKDRLIEDFMALTYMFHIEKSIEYFDLENVSTLKKFGSKISLKIKTKKSEELIKFYPRYFNNLRTGYRNFKKELADIEQKKPNFDGKAHIILSNLEKDKVDLQILEANDIVFIQTNDTEIQFQIDNIFLEVILNKIK